METRTGPSRAFDHIQRTAEGVSMEALTGDRAYRLSRDGREVMIGTERECWLYIHRTHSYSVDWAQRWEGYSLTPLASID